MHLEIEDSNNAPIVCIAGNSYLSSHVFFQIIHLALLDPVASLDHDLVLAFLAPSVEVLAAALLFLRSAFL